jgi:hypothetical protein
VVPVRAALVRAAAAVRAAALPVVLEPVVAPVLAVAAEPVRVPVPAVARLRRERLRAVQARLERRTAGVAMA